MVGSHEAHLNPNTQHTMPTPKYKTDLTTPAHLDELSSVKMTFVFAIYSPWRGEIGAAFLEYWEDDRPTDCIWEVDDLPEAKRLLKDLDPEDVGLYPEECHD